LASRPFTSIIVFGNIYIYINYLGMYLCILYKYMKYWLCILDISAFTIYFFDYEILQLLLIIYYYYFKKCISRATPGWTEVHKNEHPTTNYRIPILIIRAHTTG